MKVFTQQVQQVVSTVEKRGISALAPYPPCSRSVWGKTPCGRDSYVEREKENSGKPHKHRTRSDNFGRISDKVAQFFGVKPTSKRRISDKKSLDFVT
jgi:hypothetical protein